jgi:hypothetical protein
MKKVLLAILALVSFSALAGDIYFVCEDEKNDDLVSIAVESDKTSSLILNIERSSILLRVKKGKELTRALYHLNIKTLGERDSETIELSLFEEVIIGNYSCSIRD